MYLYLLIQTLLFTPSCVNINNIVYGMDLGDYLQTQQDTNAVSEINYCFYDNYYYLDK